MAVLCTCCQATVELSGEKFTTASKIILLTKGLMALYSKATTDTSGHPLKQDLAGQLLHQLVQRFEWVEELTILAIATLLDPRFKNQGFRQQEKKRKVVAALKVELQELDSASPMLLPQDPTPSKQPKVLSGLWDAFDAEVKQMRSAGQQTTSRLMGTTPWKWTCWREASIH